MMAVFIEDEITWDADEKRTQAEFVLFNYTARPRSYTLLAKWPERDGVEIVDESHDGIQCAERPVALDIGEETARAVEVVEVLRGDRFGAAVGTGQ